MSESETRETPNARKPHNDDAPSAFDALPLSELANLAKIFPSVWNVLFCLMSVYI